MVKSAIAGKIIVKQSNVRQTCLVKRANVKDGFQKGCHYFLKRRRPIEDAVAETQLHASSTGCGLEGHGQEYHCRKGCRKAEKFANVVNKKLERKAGS